MRFPENILWGTATAANQVEGAAKKLQRRVPKSSARWYSDGIRRNGLK
jgi:beta-glucosidase/6-phospho-beta-glucosidase/beta-galactosidase